MHIVFYLLLFKWLVSSLLSVIVHSTDYWYSWVQTIYSDLFLVIRKTTFALFSLSDYSESLFRPWKWLYIIMRYLHINNVFVCSLFDYSGTLFRPWNSLYIIMRYLHINKVFVLAVSLCLCRSVGTFARALDCSSSVKQPSLHMSAAAASRDITLVSHFSRWFQIYWILLNPYIMLSWQDPFDNSALALKGYPV